MEKLIYLIRHGETSLNRQRIVQGSGMNPGLNDTGREQAAAFYRAYGDIQFDLVITSVLKRSIETVQPFIDTNVTWIQTPDINEISWGTQEGKESTPASIELYKNLISDWQSGNYDASMPGGESAKAMGERLLRFIEMLKQRSEKKVLICMHGRAIRALVSLLKGESLSAMEDKRHANTGLYLIHQQADGQFDFLLENDTAHLETENT